jgi:hypothetical protein
MFIDNFWIGNTEYIIIYKNGTHELHKRESWEEYGKTIATGTYKELRGKVEEIKIAYLESLF